MSKSPDLFWGMIASMWVGNLLLLVINLPLIGLWVRLLKVPYRLMFPAIMVFCCIGIYSINNSPQDVLFTAFFGFAGYVLYKFGFEPAPLLLGYVLGRLMEEKLRQVACCRFHRHRVRCFDGTGGGSWNEGSSHGSSSLRRCG
jgi:putative tricarboxylic transport membrane protein